MTGAALPFSDAAACAKLAGFDDIAITIQGIARWAGSAGTHVVVCGEFKRGKSTLINALVGTKICPEDRLPATAVPMVLSYGEPSAEVVSVDGRVDPITPTVEALSQLSVGAARETGDLAYTRVRLPSPLLKAGVVLIDTPGVNDLSQQRADVTYQYLPFADTAVVVLDSTAPVTASETRFLKEAVFKHASSRILFVLGKCDRLDEDELSEAVEGARQRLLALGIDEPTLLPATTRQGAAGIGPLRAALLKLNARTGHERQSEAARRLHLQLRSLLEQVVATKTIAAAAFDRDAAMDQLQQVTETMGQRYQAVRRYTESFGRETLLELVDVSLQKLRADLTAEVVHDVESATGDLDRYMATHLPRKMELRLKGWVEAKSPELAGFLRRFISRVSDDFERAFLVPLETAGLPQGLELPRYEIARSKDTQSRTAALLTEHMLPNAIAMGAGLLILGPIGVAVGAMVGQVAGFSLRERKLEARRAELLAAVPTLVEAIISGFHAGLRAELDGWFDRLDEQLLGSLSNARDRAATRILSSAETSTSEVVERRVQALLSDLERQWPTS